jgi:hypothetical protein
MQEESPARIYKKMPPNSHRELGGNGKINKDVMSKQPWLFYHAQPSRALTIGPIIFGAHAG